MSTLLATVCTTAAAVVVAYTAWLWATLRHPHRTQRTPADVARDVATHRACRRFQQAIDDHDDVWGIWPDPPSWRVADARHRLDKHRKERGEQ